MCRNSFWCQLLFHYIRHSRFKLNEVIISYFRLIRGTSQKGRIQRIFFNFLLFLKCCNTKMLYINAGKMKFDFYRLST